MKSWQLLPVILMTFVPLMLSSPVRNAPADRQAGEKQGTKKTKAQASGLTSMSGCVDERESGRYVLVDDAKLSPIVELKAEGFSNEGFAKYLGHKVTVQGRNSAGEGRTVFTVRKIEMVSETCTPARPSPQD